MIRLLALALLFEVVTYPVQAQTSPPRPSRIAADQPQANLKPQASKAEQSKPRVRWNNASRTGTNGTRFTVRERESLFEEFLEWERGHSTSSTRSALSTSRP